MDLIENDSHVRRRDFSRQFGSLLGPCSDLLIILQVEYLETPRAPPERRLICLCTSGDALCDGSAWSVRRYKAPIRMRLFCVLSV